MRLRSAGALHVEHVYCSVGNLQVFVCIVYEEDIPAAKTDKIVACDPYSSCLYSMAART